MAFAGTGKIWMNGKLVEWKDATIHVASHVIHYGSGVFEGARCYETPKGSACFRLDAHMRRLQHSAKIYRMEYPLDLDGWMNAVLDTIQIGSLRAAEGCALLPPRRAPAPAAALRKNLRDEISVGSGRLDERRPRHD